MIYVDVYTFLISVCYRSAIQLLSKYMVYQIIIDIFFKLAILTINQNNRA